MVHAEVGQWIDTLKLENAEAFYYSKMHGKCDTPNSKSTPRRHSKSPHTPNRFNDLKEQVVIARKEVHRTLRNSGSNHHKGGGHRKRGVSFEENKDIQNRLNALEDENASLKTALEDVLAKLDQLTTRVSALDGKKSTPVKEPEIDSDDESDIDMFAGAPPEKKVYSKPVEKKAPPPGKSQVVFDIRPFDDETDMGEVEKLVREITIEGLLWGSARLEEIAYGIKKLLITSIVLDTVSVDDIQEQIEGFEELVQSVEIAAFNKL